MPSAPLYYAPLVHAHIAATPIGKTTFGDAVNAQANFQLAKNEDGSLAITPASLGAQNLVKGPPGKDGVPQAIGGLVALMSGRPGARLSEVRLSEDALGYVANRTITFFGKHPDVLDTASPEQAVDIARKVATDIEKEAAQAGTRIADGTLDVSPEVTAVLKKNWAGKDPLSAAEALTVTSQVNREVERATSPLPPDATSTRLQWLEEASQQTLALWPGASTRTAQALGLKVDPKELEAAAAAGAKQLAGDGGANQSLQGLLTLAGVNAANAGHAQQATALLQSTDLEQVPLVLGSRIVEVMKLPAERAEWVASRILEVGGHPGNVGGLAAELRELSRKPPATTSS